MRGRIKLRVAFEGDREGAHIKVGLMISPVVYIMMARFQ